MEPGTGAAARWLHTPPDVSGEPLVIITEALLPVFDWIDVPVVRAVEQKLSAVERFLIDRLRRRHALSGNAIHKAPTQTSASIR